MSTLQQLRDKVRTQLDLDSEDLPDSTVDGFLEEGFNRTFQLEQRWPFFEYAWDITLVSGETTIDLPTSPYEVASIMSLRDTDSGYRMLQVDQSIAEDYWDGDVGEATPTHFSVWADTITLWPPSTAEVRQYRIRGYRKPSWTGVAGSELDGDSRLHLPIYHYACSLAYAQLEDPELEDVYMRRWAATAQSAQKDIMRPWHHEPLILNGGVGNTWPRRRLFLDVP